MLQAHYFVIDMLVSCRHRFQKPSAAAFWSKQSEVRRIIYYDEEET